MMLLPLLFVSCGGKKAATVSRPSFCADSAYQYIATQLEFGPRVPNSKGHVDCAAFIVRKLREAGADVILQKGTMIDYSGREQQVMNIIGRFGAELNRSSILLAAHYDTRPWTDNEENYEDRRYCVPGANDGASGVGVLLEIARQLSLLDSISKPIDLVFFDLEDMGTPSFYNGAERENTWCLGSQLFAEDYLVSGSPRYVYGVLLDMVGAPDAVFPREYYSYQYAPNVQEQIWRAATSLGHGRYFSSAISYPITDDHLYLNQAGIPVVDIIHYSPSSTTGFPAWWHTRADDMENISISTLQAVGETMMALIEK